MAVALKLTCDVPGCEAYVTVAMLGALSTAGGLEVIDLTSHGDLLDVEARATLPLSGFVAISEDDGDVSTYCEDHRDEGLRVEAGQRWRWQGDTWAVDRVVGLPIPDSGGRMEPHAYLVRFDDGEPVGSTCLTSAMLSATGERIR